MRVSIRYDLSIDGCRKPATICEQTDFIHIETGDKFVATIEKGVAFLKAATPVYPARIPSCRQ
jgi:hypothetical protein